MSPSRGIGGRQVRHGGNSVVLIVVVVGILASLNYLAFRRPLKKDLTVGQRHSLSDQTKKVVGGLTEDVRIVYFQKKDEMLGADERIKQYEALSPRLKAEFVDPYVKPTRAAEYDVKGPWPIVVVERGPRRERAATESEQDLTNTILKVTREGQKTVCFAFGEGERDIDDSSDRGYTGARESLAKSQYVTKKVVLSRERVVPADCAVLVVAGPEADLLPPMVETVRAFVAAGGKALVMAEPPLKTATPNLDGMLAGWNLEAGQDVVVDMSGMGSLFGFSELTPIAVEYPYHDITRGFRVTTAFHGARSLRAGVAATPGIAAQDVVLTSPESWAESDLGPDRPAAFDEKDKRGPIPLGAVATIQVTTPEPSPGPSPSPDASPEPPPPTREGRVVAFGDVDFASNALLVFQGNRDFFLNVVAWLAEDADLISIRPREPEDQRMFLAAGQQQVVGAVALLLLPGVFVALGIWTWWKRR